VLSDYDHLNIPTYVLNERAWSSKARDLPAGKCSGRIFAAEVARGSVPIKIIYTT